MTRTGKSSLAMMAVLLLAAAGAAHGQQLQPQGQAKPKPKVKLSVDSYTAGQAASPDKAEFTGDTTHKTMEWEGASRWGVKLRVDEPVSRPMGSKDVEAGAFYKVTPAFRVGGAVGLSDKPQPAAKAAPDQTAPKVKLETTLKF